jgi:hypothetical protein
MLKTEIAREILAYLLDHPDAQDTLDGISQWWVSFKIMPLDYA